MRINPITCSPRVVKYAFESACEFTSSLKIAKWNGEGCWFKLSVKLIELTSSVNNGKVYMYTHINNTKIYLTCFYQMYDIRSGCDMYKTV